MEDFRKLMGIQPHQYKNTAMMLKKVVLSGIEEIEKNTSLKVSYEIERNGRKITHIRFKMYRNEVKITKEDTNKKIVDRLRYFGFNKNQIKLLLKQHDEDYLLANIAVIEDQLAKGKEIKNITAYLSKAFLVDFRPTENEYTKALTAKTEAKEAQRQAEQDAETQREALKAQYQAERKAGIAKLKANFSTKELADLQAEFETDLLQSDFFAQIYQTKGGLDNKIIQVKWDNFLASRFLASHLSDFENYERSGFWVGVSVLEGE